MNSKSMEEILKIKEENSKKYLKMNDKEKKPEKKRVLDWFFKALGKTNISVKSN